ncbi:MAG: T9SS type A sorting domain-containing protein [Flavobacteriia bacterium]|nr:T9SS type A sorting domain-containing protein [Flavobacteriia bacterium]
MKKLITISAFLISFYVNAQTSVYHPFPTGNANWIYEFYDENHLSTNIYTEYTINGDTSIANFTYKKVLKNNLYAGALREINKVVYFMFDTSQNEHVLYDFNIQIGDTIINNFGFSNVNDTIILSAMDSILIANEYFTVYSFSNGAIWYEGIGHFENLLNPFYGFSVSGNDQILCMHTSSGFNYPEGNISCNLAISELEKSKLTIKCFPNPTDNYLIIDFGEIVQNYKIEIINSVGERLKHEEINNQKTYQINFKDLKKGIYFINIFYQENFQKRERIVIN